MNTVRPVSTSEVGDGNKCETLWKFKYHPDYRLSPLTDGPAVTLGITGHQALEAFYTKLKDGVDYEEAAQFITNIMGQEAFKAMAIGDSDKCAMYTDLAVRLRQYFDFYKDDILDWDILEVEYKVEASETLPNGRLWNFIGRVDLIIRYRRGPFTGMVVPVDHKFVYNFWEKKAFRMSPQASGYVKALRIMLPNETVGHLLINQIRYRMDAKDLFSRDVVAPTAKKLAAVADNHAKVAKKLNGLHVMSREDVDDAATRSLVKTTCEYCLMATLCDAQLEGTDTSLMEKVNFKPNTYGYDKK